MRWVKITADICRCSHVRNYHGSACQKCVCTGFVLANNADRFKLAQLMAGAIGLTREEAIESLEAGDCDDWGDATP